MIALRRLLTTSPGILAQYGTKVLPLVQRELAGWSRVAAQIADPELRRQALASLRLKRFHCEGGAIYAAAVSDASQRAALVRFIVALQTISDYLDNLCDRSDATTGRDFAHLHRALTDALTPAARVQDYYRHHTACEDRYLPSLVAACQQVVRTLPSYHVVQAHALRQARLYNALQVCKHVAVTERERLLQVWFHHLQRRHPHWPDLAWWEFAAATGSTLGIFALALAALEQRLSPQVAQAIAEAYFPNVMGLHILLDYFIDQDEDRTGGDLNFASYYASGKQAAQRMACFQRRALQSVRGLPVPALHRLVAQGLPGLYLSDGKAVRGARRSATWLTLRLSGIHTLGLYVFCRFLRRAGLVGHIIGTR